MKRARREAGPPEPVGSAPRGRSRKLLSLLAASTGGHAAAPAGSRRAASPRRRLARLPAVLLIGAAALPAGLLGLSGAAFAQIPFEVENLVASAVGNTLRVSWDRNSGGSAPTSYDVHYTASATVSSSANVGSNAATEWVDAGHTGTTTSHTITGLQYYSTTYRVRVSARAGNALSTSAITSATTPAGFSRLPGLTPQNAPTLNTPSPAATSVTLTWSSVTPTDCSVITDYIAYIFAADDTIVAEKDFNHVTTSGTVEGLTAGTAYTAKMRTRSILGCYSGMSAAQSFTTTSGGGIQGQGSSPETGPEQAPEPQQQQAAAQQQQAAPAAAEPADNPGGGGPGGNPGGGGPVGGGPGVNPVGSGPVGGGPGVNPVGSGPVGGNLGAGGSSGPVASPASATPGAAALSTRIVGRRAQSINSPHCFVPGAAELGALPASARLAYRLDSGKDFDLCLWAPDPNWRTAPAYASCRGTGGAFPEYASLVKGPGREELSVERALKLMACVVPAGTASEGGAWQLRIAPGNPGPEDSE